MKLFEGFTLVELTDDKIVQEMVMPNGGKVTLVGNPHPERYAEEREKAVREITEIIDRAVARKAYEDAKKKKQA